MKILIIKDNVVTEFIPLSPNKDNQNQSQKTLNLLKESLKLSETKEEESKVKLYTITKLVKIFETSRPTIYAWIEKGLLKPIKLSGRVYFKHEDIEALLEKNSQ